MLIGSHLPLSGPLYFEETAKLALSFGETAMMFYTGAPQNSRRLPLDKMRIGEGDAVLEGKIALSSRVVHAPYIINLANRGDLDKLKAMEGFLRSELERAARFSAPILVLHPGSHLGLGSEAGIKNLLLSLEETLADYRGRTRIALETMAGKGGEIGRSFEEIAAIINGFSRPELLSVTLDTCHLNDAGYDVSDLPGIKSEIERTFGIGKVACIHLNDSKNPRSSHKDRHENMGYGTIGFATLEKWASDPDFADVPKILETPYYKEKPPYGAEIAMLRSGVYVEGWRERL